MARPITAAGSAGNRKRTVTYIKPKLWHAVKVLAVTREVPTWSIAENALVLYLAKVAEEDGNRPLAELVEALRKEHD